MIVFVCGRCRGRGLLERAALSEGGPNIVCVSCGHRRWLARDPLLDVALTPYAAPSKPKYFQEPKMAGEIKRRGAA